MKQKIMVGILVMLMITVSMVGVLNSSVRAFDTNPTPFGYINGPGGPYTVHAVAWNDSGTHAMLVGEDYAADLNWYGQSISSISGLNSGDYLYDVCFDGGNQRFYAVGNSTGPTGGAVAYEWQPGTGSAMTTVGGLTLTTGDVFKKVEMGYNGFMAVGNDLTGPLAEYYDFGSASWNSISIASGSAATAVSFVNGYFFIFVDNSPNTEIYQISEADASSGASAALLSTLYNITVNDAESNPDNIDITAVGYNSETNGTIFTFNGANGLVENTMNVTVTNNALGYNLEFLGIAWDTTGQWATIVGNDDSFGPVVYSYTKRATYAGRLDYTGGDPTVEVAIRPPHSPASSTIVGASTGGVTTLSTTTATQPITVATIYPHINYIDIYDNASNSYMNRQMDVDEDSATDEFYYVEVDASYGSAVSGLSWLNIGYVDVYASYDAGSTLTDNYDITDPVGKENIQFHFKYDNSLGSWSLEYPKSGEVQFFDTACSDTPVDAYHHTLDFAFAPQQQVHNGSAGTEGANIAPNNRYSETGTWVIEDQNTTNALNDPYTWDMHVYVVDTTGSAYANAYDEFGIYKFTDLGAWSYPGDMSAAAAPNTPNVHLQVLGNPTFDLTYRSNCEYQIRVYLDNDLLSGTTADVIPASNLAVQGGTLAVSTYFSGSGSGNALYLVGDSVGPTYVQPQASGTSTTTSQVVGGTGNPLAWTVDIPVVAEASYTANAVYEIVHP